MSSIFRASLLAVTFSILSTSTSFASHKHSASHPTLDAPRALPAPCAHKAAHKRHDLPGVTMSIVIKAQPRVVWEAIQHERRAGGDQRKLISYDGNRAVLEEKFASLPILGAASCVYAESETPIQRIDYSLVHSERFHAFEGSWTLTPLKDGSHTLVELSNSLDPGIRVPFWQELTKAAAARHVKKRLEDITTYVETMQSHTIAELSP